MVNMVVMEEIYEVFDKSEKIAVYSDGVKCEYSPSDANFANILAKWNELITDSHRMPAYGVSINEYTLESLKSGLWVEFIFGKEYSCGGMPFQKLLVEVKEGFYGFNIIRYTKKYGYDGRCFYIDLNGKTMTDFYAFLADL